ncbi:CCA tRNA nucleotidyltransferase [Leuconostoc gasicomitatum]|uniref:CCA tRNA nucleotidyltransferase n=1 Tax=Leuconostoc gasicomitatum TaxID=115778 RepID=UPI001CC63B95|nr:CCA tRNA nucleotidyltransferase [Leuconostoc gasicomitatum]MBR2277266.1 CCA tRNA nucleotidyltransferase [Leuconostoc sp.]MBZ5953471.1 CCA tRNA nucleotidyltransferase [Leuconostoc gasicomitatum]MBZ5954556.1 CCA tRNA nucleotidyltransferase [Leuconostoc gasicomitatum]
MKINTLPQEFIDAQPVLKTLENAGFEAYFVGGAVRDMLLNKPIHDVDIATSAFPEEVKSLFNKTIDTGIQHGTVMALDHGAGYEITTFRTESTYTDFRRPDKVTFVRSLKEDLKRRDFTINALAMNYSGNIVDLFDGLSDLKNGIVRAVGDAEVRFTEDALRMMRALRFSAQLEFAIDFNTQQALRKLAPNLEKIAVERIRVEFEKILMGSQASESLQIASRDQVMAYLPGDIGTWDLSRIILDLESNQADTTQIAWIHLLARSDLNEKKITQFMRMWKMSREDIKVTSLIVPLVRHIETVRKFQLYQVYAYRDILLSVLYLMGVPDEKVQQIDTNFATLPISKSADMAINGADLIMTGLVKPGPEMGRTLKMMEKAVVLGQLENKHDVLLTYIKELKSDDKN